MALKDQLASFIDRQTTQGPQGTIGYRNSDGTYTTDVPGGDGYVFVTFGGENGYGGVVGIARNFGGATPKLPVWIRQRLGAAQVIGSNETKLSAYNPSGNGYAFSVPKHTHAVGSGNVDPVDANRFTPGLVRPFREGGSFGLKVYIEPTTYEYQGVLVYFGGTALDLSSLEPSASTKAWIVVGIDPVTNTATAKAGTEYALAVTMNPSQLNGFDFAGAIPLGAVIYRNGATAFNNFADFADLRIFSTNSAATTSRAVATYTADHTATLTDNLIKVDATGGNVTITLPPAAAAAGDGFTIKRIDSSANTVTVDGDGSETIDDETTKDLDQYTAIQIVSDGTEWWII